MERVTAIDVQDSLSQEQHRIAYRARNRRVVTYDSIALTNATKAYL
jgi:hypothetical protein